MRNLLMLLFLFCFSLSFGSEKYDCVYKKSSKTDVIKKYPFNVAEKIIWVNWKAEGTGMPKTMKDFNTDKIHWEIFSDTISINQPNKIKLSDILFNYKYRIKGEYDLSSKCYIPRDAILFLDKNGVLIDYVEVCFECEDYRLMTAKWHFDFCEGKIKILSAFRDALLKK